MKVETWNPKNGELTFEKLRELYPKHPEKGDYRVSLHQYKPGDRQGYSLSKQRLIFVLKGELSVEHKHGTVRLKAGDIFHAPEGEFTYNYLGNDPIEYVNVFNATEIIKEGMEKKNLNNN